MAELVAILATTHHPFYYATSQLPPEQAPPFAAEWVRKVEAYRETLTRARPDVLVMVGSDHFHQLWLDNMPQFLVGKAPFYDANYYNEEREFGLPRLLLKGHEELSAHILREGIDAGFDLAGMAWVPGGVNLVGDRSASPSGKGYAVHVLSASSSCDLTVEARTLFAALPPVALVPVP